MPNVHIAMEVRSARGPAETAAMTRELQGSLRSQGCIRAELVTRPATPGERSGTVELLGQLALSFAGGGGAIALLNCIKTYLDRDRSLRVRLKRPDGQEIEIEGTNLDIEAVSAFVLAAEAGASTSRG